LVARNCAAVPESLAETEMFGYEEKSGIQNADPKGVPGWFELAHGGTLFLDEIQALSLPLQDKLLRVLEDGQVWRVAARRPRRVDVRVVGATDIDPARAIEEGRFRKPLYYRFGKTIGLPPLRKRREDIPLLAFLFLDRYATRSGSKARTISHRALQVLGSHSWPGNVRELENAVRDAVSRNKEVILCADLPPALTGASQARETRGHLAPAFRAEEEPKTWSETERQVIEGALKSTRGNITKAAEILKVARMTVINMMKRHSIPRDFGKV
jgi:transcriptional regulator with PAS, ATPase and Fis domain